MRRCTPALALLGLAACGAEPSTGPSLEPRPVAVIRSAGAPRPVRPSGPRTDVVYGVRLPPALNSVALRGTVAVDSLTLRSTGVLRGQPMWVVETPMSGVYAAQACRMVIQITTKRPATGQR